VKRGAVIQIDFGEGVGSEAEGERPAVVVSVDQLNSRLESLVVVPTSGSDLPGKRKHRNNLRYLPCVVEILDFGFVI